jgi:hypothetical protein
MRSTVAAATALVVFMAGPLAAQSLLDRVAADS